MKTFLNIFLYLITIIINAKYCLESENNYSIIFPFEFIPNKDPELTPSLNFTNMNLIMKNIFLNDIYIKMEIGSPSQIINLRISANIEDFFISKENAIYEEKYSKKNGSFYFDQFKSSTFSYQNEDRGNVFISHRHLSEYAKDTFSFYYTNNKKKTIHDFPFFLAYKVNGPNHGVMGLKGLSKDNKNDDIFSLLKKNKLIKNNIWYLDYNNNKNYNGSLYIGNYPHNDKNIIKKGKNAFLKINHFRKIYSTIFSSSWDNQCGLTFDKIYLKNTSITPSIGEEILDDCQTCKNAMLNPNIGVIIGAQKFKSIFEKIYLNKYLNNKKCFQPMFDMTIKYVKRSFYYYYCDISYLQEMKNDFKPIIFEHNEFKFNFSLEFDDLYVIKNNYIFLKIIFYSQRTDWILGGPFTEKYLFIFNSDSKEIGFYSKNINDIVEENNEKKEKISFMNIIQKTILGLLLIVIGIIIGKKLFGLRRKLRANELEEKFEDSPVGRQNLLI